MLRKMLKSITSQKQQRAMRAWARKAKLWWVKRFRRYDAADLRLALQRLGVTEADTLLVHANFEADSGFEGSPSDVVNAFADLVGEHGNLLMVSIPFRDSAYDYLLQNKPFNVKRTMSMMGLITETFRRRPGTLRSLHPTHPVLALGKDAAWIVADHESCRFPCGIGTPFEKFLELDGKILFFDVGFGAITFFHFVEDVIKDRLPFPAYEDRLFSVTVVDAAGCTRTVETYAFTKGVKRDTDKVLRELERRSMVRRARVGNSRLILVRAKDVLSVMEALVDARDYPYSGYLAQEAAGGNG